MSKEMLQVKSHFLQFLKHPYGQTLLTLSTPIWQRTLDSHMLSTNMLVIKLQLNLGELEELLLEFPVSAVVVPTDQVRVLLETCVEVDVCLHQPKHGGDGIDQSTKTNAGMQYVLH